MGQGTYCTSRRAVTLQEQNGDEAYVEPFMEMFDLQGLWENKKSGTQKEKNIPCVAKITNDEPRVSDRMSIVRKKLIWLGS